MSGCDSNGLCKFVGDGGNQFSHRADSARMSKISLELFGTFAALNVRCRATPFHNLPALVPHRDGAYQEPAIDSIRSPTQPRFIIQRCASRLRLPPSSCPAIEVVGVNFPLPS